MVFAKVGYPDSSCPALNNSAVDHHLTASVTFCGIVGGGVQREESFLKGANAEDLRTVRITNGV